MKKNLLVNFIFAFGVLVGLNSFAVPTYKANILPLVTKYCGACHGDGSESGNLLDYKTAFSMKDAISKAVSVDKSMPMGANGKKITADERALFGQWVTAGAPEGEAQPTPTPSIPTFKHPPYAQNKCGSCHVKDAAGQVIANQFTKTQPDMCYQCHDRQDTGKVIHPALKGKCTQCHRPHESTFKLLLKDKVVNLCVGCHDAPGMENGKHSAVDMLKSCVRCHSPHSSDQPHMLLDKTPKLCVYCHTDIGKGLADPANTIHPAIQMGCQACHEPHGSVNGSLLKKPLNDLCFKCHNQDTFKNGHPINGHPQSMPNDPLHPERPFTCISCHKPHFSGNENLLRYRFKQAPYDGTICSVCHWSKYGIQTQPPTPKWDEQMR